MNDTIFVALDAPSTATSGIILTFVSAFAGAFFAFLFLQVASFINNIYKINKTHFEALNKIELMGNEHVDAIGRSIYNINLLIQQFKKAQKIGSVLISPNRPKTIAVDKSLILDLINVDIMNSLFSYQMKVERCNSDITSINSLLEFFVTSLQQKTIDNAVYMANLEICIQKFSDIKIALNYLKDVSISLTAAARIRKRSDKPTIYKVKYLLVRRSNEANFDELLNKEIELCKKEIEEVTERSKGEIDKMTNKT